MTQISIEIDPRDYMSENDWEELRAEALDELLAGRGICEAGFVGDLIDARTEILRHAYSDALCLIERAIRTIRGE